MNFAPAFYRVCYRLYEVASDFSGYMSAATFNSGTECFRD
jgi:hypothetical protein